MSVYMTYLDNIVVLKSQKFIPQYLLPAVKSGFVHRKTICAEFLLHLGFHLKVE